MQNTTNDQLREFSVSKGKRRANSLHLMRSTLGGKIALGLIAAFLLLAALSPLYSSGILDWLYGDTTRGQSAADSAYMKQAVTVAASGFWLIVALVALVCAFKQRNVGVAMRKDEHLSINRSTLTYSFHSASGRFNPVSSLNVVMIDLEASMITYDETQRHWVFEGEVFGHYYRYPEDEPLLSMREMEPIPRFTISSHFEDPFDEIMQTFAKGGQR